jgi:very-short-patch-repair endonuclease
MIEFQIQNINTYPRIITPNYIKYASNLVTKFEEVYPNVKKPSFPDRKKVDENNELKILGGGIGCGFLIYFVIGLTGLFISDLFLDISTETWKAYWFPTILIISIIGGIVAIIAGFKGIEQESKKSESEYKINYDKYLSDLKKYNNILSEVKSEGFQNKERQKRKKTIFEENKKQIFKRLEILDDNAVKKGVSEEFFYRFLLKYSDITVYKSIKYSFYFPDLLLVKNDLVIVLEIDEPYTLEKKEPIHFEDSDKIRDEFFVNNNFIVLRFTEEQVISYPEKCLHVINEIIESCFNLNLFKKSNSFLEIETIKWTHQEAFDLAYKNSRINVPERIQKLEVRYLS